jgi:hypothetical protein
MKWIESLKVRWVTWVWKHSPNCAEMARLSSARLDRDLAWYTRLKMRLHFLICIWCHRYERQLELLRSTARGMDNRLANSAKRGLSPEARKRIVTHLHKAICE